MAEDYSLNPIKILTTMTEGISPRKDEVKKRARKEETGIFTLKVTSCWNTHPKYDVFDTKWGILGSFAKTIGTEIIA